MEKDLIEYIAKSLVNDKNAVYVTENEDGDDVFVELKVSENDIGKIIGKYGRIAKALRTVLNASCTKNNRRCNLEIIS